MKITHNIVISIISIPLIVAIYCTGQYLYEWLIKVEISEYSQIEYYMNDRGCNNCHQNGISIVDKKPQEHQWSYPTINIQSYFGMKRLSARYKHKDADSNKLYQGEKLARQYMCFNCHGLYGQGGLDNKGSLKGYIPGWLGQDFAHLTDNGNPQAIKEWIRFGMYQKILESPLTGYFAKKIFERQETNMIALPGISEQEVDILVDYVIYINKLGKLTPENITLYEQEVRNKTEVAKENNMSHTLTSFPGISSKIRKFLGYW